MEILTDESVTTLQAPFIQPQTMFADLRDFLKGLRRVTTVAVAEQLVLFRRYGLTEYAARIKVEI